MSVADVKIQEQSGSEIPLIFKPIKMVQDKKLPAVTIILDHQSYDTKSHKMRGETYIYLYHHLS